MYAELVIREDTNYRFKFFSLKLKLKSVMQALDITLLGLRPRVGVKLLGLWPRVKPNFCGFWDQNLNLYVPTFCILEFAARSE